VYSTRRIYSGLPATGASAVPPDCCFYDDGEDMNDSANEGSEDGQDAETHERCLAGQYSRRRTEDKVHY
jgi:hypothetical protein